MLFLYYFNNSNETMSSMVSQVTSRWILKVHQRVRSGLNQIDKPFRHTQSTHKSGSSFAFWVVKLLIWLYWTTSLPVVWYTAPLRVVSTCKMICTPGTCTPKDINYLCFGYSLLLLFDTGGWRSLIYGLLLNIEWSVWGSQKIPCFFSTANIRSHFL